LKAGCLGGKVLITGTGANKKDVTLQISTSTGGSDQKTPVLKVNNFSYTQSNAVTATMSEAGTALGGADSTGFPDASDLKAADQGNQQKPAK
jgi:hypothetical protein